jgi:RimJ/RimL family protein N-acetyltransferase
VSDQQADLHDWQPRPLPESVTLEGHWVVLEPLSAVDHAHDLWQAVLGEDHVWDWMADGPYVREADFVQALEAKEFGTAARFFAICPRLDNGSVGAAKGYASLMRMDPANGVIEVGNVLFSPSLQRTAAATEAMYLMARYSLEDLGYRRYEWKCNAQNLPSRRAAERFGFEYEGVFRQHMVIKGCNRDTAWYAMLDGEWPARKAAFEAWLAPANFDEQGRQLRSLQSIAASPVENGSR